MALKRIVLSSILLYSSQFYGYESCKNLFESKTDNLRYTQISSLILEQFHKLNGLDPRSNLDMFIEAKIHLVNILNSHPQLSPRSKLELTNLINVLTSLVESKILPDNFTSIWLKAVNEINKNEGLQQARENENLRKENVKLKKHLDDKLELQNIFLKMPTPKKAQEIILTLDKARTKIHEIQDSGFNSAYLDKMLIFIISYEDHLRYIPNDTLSDSALTEIYKNVQQIGINFQNNLELTSLSFRHLAETEIKKWSLTNKTDSLKKLNKSILLLKELTMWWLTEISALESKILREQKIKTMFFESQKEIDHFLKNEYLASDESIQKLADHMQQSLVELIENETISLATSPKLNRIPQYPDPGDNVNIEAINICSNELLPTILKKNIRATDLNYVLQTIHSVFHWLAKLDLSPEIKKSLSDISVEAHEDRSKIAPLIILETLRPSSNIRDTIYSYVKYYQKFFKKLSENLEKQKYSGTQLSSGQRLSNSMDLLVHYINYLQAGEFDKSNIVEITIVGKIVFQQFLFTQEFLQNPGARALVDHVHKQFLDYINHLANYGTSNNTLNFEKENVIQSLLNLSESLQTILRLEDINYKINLKTSSKTKIEEIDEWTTAPLNYTEWVNKFSKKLKKIGEYEKSIQWALYVFKIKEIPANDESRKTIFRKLASIYYPNPKNELGSNETMASINAANAIIKREL